MRSVQLDEQDTLEKLIDACGLQNVLYALDNICELKRDHIEVSYGDANLAQRWHSVGVALTKLANSAKLQDLPQ